MDDQMLIIIAIAVATILLVLVVVRVAMWFQWFQKELRYLNKEIDRTTGKEQEHWIRRKKRLLRSLIPFVRY